MTDGYQPNPPPMERPKRGPKLGTKRGPRKNATPDTTEATSVIDTLDVFARISAQLAVLPARHRRSILAALNDRFPT